MNRIYFVRHGENPANISMEFSSRKVDYSLTEKGRLQARQTAEFFKGKGIDEIYASPLKRAKETAQVIADELSLSVTLMENFRELQVGDLEVLPPSKELWEEHDRIFMAWMTGDPDEVFPNGDNYHALWGRMRAGILQIVSGKQGKNIVIVGHGGQLTATLKDLCREVDLLSLLMKPTGNCSITEIEMEIEKGEPVGRLVEWSYIGHLYGEASNLVLGFPEDGTFNQSRTSGKK